MSVYTLTDAETAVTEAFQEVGAHPDKFVLHYGSRMNQMTNQEMIASIHQLQQLYGLKEIKKEPTPGQIRYHVEGWFRKNIFIAVHFMNDAPNRSRMAPYVSVQLIGQGVPDKAFRQAVASLTRWLADQHMAPTYHFSIQGKVIGARSVDQKRVVEHVFRRLSAKAVEEMNTSRTLSVSAYSPLIHQSLKTKDQWMNLQVASRIDDQSRGLILTIGTPIITIEY